MALSWMLHVGPGSVHLHTHRLWWLTKFGDVVWRIGLITFASSIVEQDDKLLVACDQTTGFMDDRADAQLGRC